jgi:hypothetical protein
MMLKPSLPGILAAMLFALALAACKDQPTANDPALGVPGNLRVVADSSRSDSTLIFRWDAPSDSVSVTGYHILWRGASSATGDSADADPAQRMLAVAADPAGSYIFSVVAMHGARSSGRASITWGGARYPLPPMNPRVQFDQSGVAHLGWDAPADTGITGYRIEWWEQGPGPSVMALEVQGVTQADIQRLDPTKRYGFEVESVRGSYRSEPVYVGWDGYPLHSPMNLKATALNTASIALTWSRPNDTGTITYRVMWRSTDNTDSASTSGLSSTGFTVYNLYPN